MRRVEKQKSNRIERTDHFSILIIISNTFPQAVSKDGEVLEGLWSKNGTLDTAKLKILSRTYAPAVAGRVTLMNFDVTDAKFVLTFQANTTVTAPTVVFVNGDMWYPSGFDVQVQPSTALNVDTSSQKNYISLTYTSQATQGAEVQVTVTRK